MTENVLDETGDFRAEADRADADGTAVIWLHGEMDVAAAPLVMRRITAALDAMPQTVAVELGGVTFLDSNGLRALIAAHHRAVKQGCAFILRSPQASVLKLLKLTGMDRVMLIDEGQTAADRGD